MPSPAITVTEADLTLPQHQEHNHHARAVYAAAGFAQSVHVPEAGGALCLSKPL